MTNRPATRWLAVALAIGALDAAGAAPSEKVTIETVVTGTAHQALFAVAFDGDAGVAVGAGGQIVTTGDLGKSWQPVAPPPTSLGLLGVDVKASRAVAVGQSGLILVRDSSGTWRKVPGGTDHRLFAVSVNTKGIAVAVGEFGTIIRSDDGGQQWKSVAPAWTADHAEQGVEPHLYDVKVAEDGLVTLVGEFGLILRSADAGSNWAILNKGDASLFALDLGPEGVGYAVGQSGAILRTADGGARWSSVDSGSKANLLGVRSLPDGKVVVTAMRAMLASDDGLQWRQISGGDFGSGWYAGVNVYGSGTGAGALVVGHSGRIVRIVR